MKNIELKSIDNLKKELNKLPGIGPKTAQRLAYHIVKLSHNEASKLANAIMEVKAKIKYCNICFNISEEDLCNICKDESRDKTTICVVQEPHNLLIIEKSHIYKGLYHVLLGALSPLHGIGPDDIKMKELINRIKSSQVHEVIIATNPNIEGEATAAYIIKTLKPFNIKISRIAFGVPVGADLDYIDEATMARALIGRSET
jgi:recombination protein RecR